ncbi:hypothetical protein Nepgr_030667 [Nepenthes gracilis]|uniref:Secreted protein n=1 Tax=Nepenthes gracilis TaxID=150966 RepID=A0AAD3TGL2_NEPGR|nr:hypothetical protein Nepgr_030667 [Nepenthes gracilis]
MLSIPWCCHRAVTCCCCIGICWQVRNMALNAVTKEAHNQRNKTSQEELHLMFVVQIIHLGWLRGLSSGMVLILRQLNHACSFQKLMQPAFASSEIGHLRSIPELKGLFSVMS